MKRFKNYGLWVAVAALVGMILQDAGVSITPEKYDGYVDAILTVLVLAGIINNPSSGRGFRDEE
jgi:uncharacterized membrane protein